MNILQIGAESPWLVRAGAAALLYTHIAGGSFGMVSGTAALALKKGSRAHIVSGRIFLVSILAMGSVGAAVAPFLRSSHGDPKLFDAIAGLFTCYLAVTGWITLRRKPGTTGAFERIACAFAFLVAAGTVALGVAAKADPDGVFGGSSATGFFGIGAIVALAAILDLKVVLSRGVTGTARIARHVWRMGLALWVAIGSFFLGQQRVMPESVQGSPLLFVPPLAVLAIILFWLVWLRIGKRVRGAIRTLRERAPAAVMPGAGS